MADPKLTPALPRAQVTTPQLEKPAAKPAAPKPEVGAPGLSEKQKSRIGGADYMTKTQAPHVPTKTPPPPPPSKELLALDELGRMMLATTTQVNSVSYALGNDNDICGGAAMVSALILRSTTPEAAKANAGALRAAFNASPMKALTSVDVQSHVSSALKNFEAGKLSEEDVCYLQQAAYAIAKGELGESSERGISTGAMAAMVADLTGFGATLGRETSFTQVHDGSNGHWVGESAGLAINTAVPGTPPASVTSKELKLDKGPFSGRVRILQDKSGARVVQFQSRLVPELGPDGKTRFVPSKPPGSGLQGETTPLKPGDKLMQGLVGSNAQRLGSSTHKVPLLRD